MSPKKSQAKSLRSRGRPRGRTANGLESSQRLYQTAIEMIAERGYQETTLRDVARRAKVSVGLLYRYFPSKSAVLLALYDNLSMEFANRAAPMKSGSWPDRFVFTLKTSLDTLGPNREALKALAPVLVADAEEGLFAPATSFSRRRVQSVFNDAIIAASDAPERRLGAALARILYLLHLAVILWWILDKSPKQRATSGLIRLIARTLPTASLALRIPLAVSMITAVDRLFQDAFGKLNDGP